ncbi:alanine--tRNA ligase [Buchnera aphidicola]|uniref:alanine--tRNA ligase n=1 Tax=Buchnera aphidicola TaxID=9 RepID=UPI0031B8A27E
MKYTTNNVRNMFLNFFQEKKHTIVPGSQLVQNENSDLLFTNAGMNQFKTVFLGKKKYPFSKVTTVQKCLRTGGKHNDLNEVGYSNYHNTFFEMLGNFSFGEYSKKTAITYAWELLTHKKWFNIPQNKLFVTVYYTDEESYNIWKKKIKLPNEDIIKIYDKKNKKYESDNFWQMGDTGPCGPCTEIFFKKKKKKSYINDLQNKEICIEIWNIVFIQFNKIQKNSILPLPILSIDTGMGLERITSILQNVPSNYKIDFFDNIIKKINYKDHNNHFNNQSLYIIADHLRAIIFIIYEGIIPNNEGQGYILRKIIRRTLVHMKLIKYKKYFLYQLIPTIIQFIQPYEKKLIEKKTYIQSILQQEELQFKKILDQGVKKLLNELHQLNKKELDGNFVFYLYDTMGFPIDLTKSICHKKNIYINQNKLDKIILKNKKNIKNKKNKNCMIHITNLKLNNHFVGYKTKKIDTVINSIFVKNKPTKVIKENENGIIFIEKTPFFAESGGQIGDSGIIYKNGSSLFQVQDTQKFSNYIGHIGKLLSGIIKNNDIITAEINKKKRLCIQNNHTATHLLHAALILILNHKIEQRGSFINHEYIRFDFSYFKKIHKIDILNTEDIVNQYIQKNTVIMNNNMQFIQAKKEKYIYLKNKTYDSIVRTVNIGHFSREICKGTHANRTGDIGIFKIISYKRIAYGVVRIEALTGLHALKNIHDKYTQIYAIKKFLNINDNIIIPKINTVMQNYLNLKKNNEYLKQKIMFHKIKKIIAKKIKIKKINFICKKIDITQSKLVKKLIDQIKNMINTGIIILYYQKKEKYIFTSSVTKNIINKINAIQIIEIIKKNTNGSGGGKVELAECVGNNINNIFCILETIKHTIEKII